MEWTKEAGLPIDLSSSSLSESRAIMAAVVRMTPRSERRPRLEPGEASAPKAREIRVRALGQPEGRVR